MRSEAELFHDQTKEIGMIKPCLQDVGLHLAKDAVKPKQPARIRRAAPNAEAYQLDTRPIYGSGHIPGTGNGDDQGPEPVSIGACNEAGQHALGASGLEPGDKMDDRYHNLSKIGPYRTACTADVTLASTFITSPASDI
jgi:hypothetical protein